MKLYRVLGKRGRVTIPYEIRTRVGFSFNDILSFTETDNGNSVIVKREKICDECRAANPDRTWDTVSLQDFLDSLSPQEQQAALVHLSVIWAEKQGGTQNA